MARRGDVIANPATGERIAFLETAGDTGGQLLRLDLTMPPGVAVPAAHIHPSQEERFALVTGSARFRVGRERFTARAGEAVVVPPGTPHRFWNDGGEELRTIVEFRPALRIEQFFEQLWSGKLTNRGMPSVRLMVEMAPENYLEEVVLAGVPLRVQRALQRVLAALARLVRGSAVIENRSL